MSIIYTHVKTHNTITACGQAKTTLYMVVSMNNVVLASMNNVVLASMNNVELASMNNIVLANMNNVELASMNNRLCWPI